ncbi:MAG: hypothetical protein J6R88_00605, partial [Clostridia bacterium]|nr:hypothetical protein [Clostridia bacterium]
MNITLYAPNYNDDIEQIKQKYSDWVKNSNEVSQKFKDSFNPNYLCVDKKWKLCVEVDFNYLSVKTSGYTIDEKRYHVDAKFG